MKYFDSRYGPFPYCSPSCRDQHLLPDYNKKLKEHIESVTVSNNSVSLLDQQIHKQDVKVEECLFVGNEPSAVTTDVSTALSRKHVSNSDNEKNPNSSMASKADSQPDHSITSSKDLIVTGMFLSDVLSPIVDYKHGMIINVDKFYPAVYLYPIRKGTLFLKKL